MRIDSTELSAVSVINLDALSSRFLSKAAQSGRPLGERNVALTPEVEAMLSRQAVVAIGVSGGKDSDACALAVARYLDKIGHTGPRLLVHSDLGRIEWKDSLPSCERLAEKLGWELLVVRRGAGDMLARWQGRWANNLKRYADLSCVKVILPWSTPSLRFCTSEFKSNLVSGALRKRFPTEEILNVVGVRRQESANRAKMPVSQESTLLKRKRAGGLNWNAIVELDDRTHDPDKDALRDALTGSAGIQTIRFESCRKPNARQIRAAMLPMIAASQRR